MSHSPSQDNGDDRHNGCADGHEEGMDASLPSQATGSEDSVSQEEIADLMLVEALLSGMSEQASLKRENLVERVMETVREPPQTRRSRNRITRWPTFAAVAASLLIVVALVAIQSARNTLASDVLTAVNRASSTSVDRVYTVRRVVASSDASDLPRGTLYLRGREGFVVTWGDVVLGRHADQFWLVESRCQVTLANNFDWIDAHSSPDQLGVSILQELSLQSLQVPLMQLASVAELMQGEYQVELCHVKLHGQPVDLLIGRRKSSVSELPKNIRLWADVDSRVIRRAELDWGPGNAIHLDLTSGEPIAGQWYDYSAHCVGEPTVRHIPSGT